MNPLRIRRRHPARRRCQSRPKVRFQPLLEAPALSAVSPEPAREGSVPPEPDPTLTLLVASTTPVSETSAGPLTEAVQTQVRLGLVAPRAAMALAALPRGNQRAAADIVIARARWGRLVQLAGFGETVRGDLEGLQFLVENVVDVDDDWLITDGQGRSGACIGDSGGTDTGVGRGGTRPGSRYPEQRQR